MLKFDIEVKFRGQTERLFWDDKIKSTSTELLKDLKERLHYHFPVVVTIPGGVDYTDDVNDMQNVYNAIGFIYSDIKIKKALPDDFDPNVIY
ncbi:hypothetical protein [Paucilactobacillus sp. N302-9]